MQEILGIPLPLLGAQIILGLVNGTFYAILSLGLALVFGLLNIVNFAHGTFYMLGAFASLILYSQFGVGYWWALLIVPVMVGCLGVALERLLIRHVYKADHIYGLLLTLGITLVIDGIFRSIYGVSGLPYPIPTALRGAVDLGILMLPIYRLWAVGIALLVCLATWFCVEKTRLGSYLRAATENPRLASALGLNVPLLVTLTFGFGVALAAFAGVLAAPIFQVSPLMGTNIIIIVFAVVVIGGMGSILGSIATGLGLGLVESITKVVAPEASNLSIFVVMIIVLMARPAGLFGRVA
ncbi:branched-chain amino acid ABC transporter permease [Ensifer sp. ENS04]|uniref:branched-chain amino acid ABC transporter permease n=1 Tax=Ensifer sp. ENS04 TaxID=2769281 RepID=UPI00177D50D6|nr:branched-chain amino acid ABC transporter permease [Ensifer sp. ENS04]MBD9541485.1 branched-chain amino acid ABC transporter permease [Ensifer sp. ENS04]